MCCYNHFWNSRHADCIRSKRLISADFCRCFISRSSDTDIDTLIQLDTKLISNFLSGGTVFWSVRFRHIRETWTKFIQVFTNQRILASHIDVVRNGHQCTRTIADTTGSIGHNNTCRTKGLHHTHWESNDFQRISFIEMETALQCQDFTSCQVSID